MNVTYLKTCTVSGKSARTQCRKTSFVGHLGQRVGLIHKLRQLRGAKERVDDRGQSLGVDQVNGCKDFVVPHVHSFTYGSCHSGKSYTKLVGQLFANGPYAAVAQMVYIVYNGLGVDQLYQVADDGYDIFFCQYPYI